MRATRAVVLTGAGLAATVFVAGCTQQPAGEAADTVYTNGRMLTTEGSDR